MEKVYLLLGGNIGEIFDNLKKTISLIENDIGKIILKSSIYETAPWGFKHKNAFLNQLVCVETFKSPQEVLSAILKIELIMGRMRDAKKWKERIMDIDILFYNDIILNENNLTIPHPYLQHRRFALIPLMEIVSDLIHPVLNKTIKTLLDECEDELDVKCFSECEHESI